MFVQSHNIMLQKTLVDALIAALSARPGAALLVTPFVHLYTAQTAPPSPTSLVTDFTEATFDGYAPAALTLPLVAPLQLSDDYDGGTNEVNFIGDAVVPPGEVILGYWIDDAASSPTKIYAAEQFSTPVPIANPGDFVSLDVIFPAMKQPTI